MEVIIIKKYDLIGQKFGKLTVLEKTINPNKKRRTVAWICKCDCGNEHITDTTSLINGTIVQCKDCSHKQGGLKRRIDLVGQRFGKLIVTSMIHERINGKSKTSRECVCDCGNTVKRSIDSLKKPNIDSLKSCGCTMKEISDKKSKKVIGMKFGNLTVLEEYSGDKRRKLKCLCDCGNEVIVSKGDVLSGHTESCGCLQVKRATEANTKDWTGYVSDYGVKLLCKSHQDKKGKWLWECECSCGNHFIALPITVAKGHKTSCGCRRRSSREALIEDCLISNGIDYKCQYSFPDCKNKYVLKFDFAILKDGEVFCLIEYDGMQHYKPINHFGGVDGFSKTSRRDLIKNEYCLDKNIPLVRLKYDLSDDEIKEIIANILNP